MLFKQMINGCKGYKGTSGIETNGKFEYVVVVCYELNSCFEYERKPRISEYKYSNINDAIETYKEEMEPDDINLVDFIEEQRSSDKYGEEKQ